MLASFALVVPSSKFGYNYLLLEVSGIRQGNLVQVRGCVQKNAINNE
jgi:hypothetical protein